MTLVPSDVHEIVRSEFSGIDGELELSMSERLQASRRKSTFIGVLSPRDTDGSLRGYLETVKTSLSDVRSLLTKTPSAGE